MSASNISFGLFPGLTRGAAEAIAAHASGDLQEAYLARLVSGEWTGAMALTESGAGTDLALLKTKAVANGDGSHAITGQKIFISSGDHDFGGNVVHLVLARLPDAPEGVKGISLFLVPKFRPDPRGEFTVRNAMSVGALEEKMGIHAQPTCVMNYDGAVGWLVGEPNRGLAAMFTMMNAERLYGRCSRTWHCRRGIPAGGRLCEGAAAGTERRWRARSCPDHRACRYTPDAAHRPRFRGGGRALAGWTALQLDRSHRHPDAAERAKADALVALLTPVVKAAFTDLGFESAVQAQQVFGGYGYIREWGMEQYVRDARIAQIYEGTNGVQAMDLVGRKIAMAGGGIANAFFALVSAEIAEAGRTVETVRIASATAEALELLKTATASLKGATLDSLGAAAVEYLKLFSLVSLGWMWTRMADAASAGDTPLHSAKIKTADFFAARMLPMTSGLAASVAAGPTTIMALSEGLLLSSARQAVKIHKTALGAIQTSGGQVRFRGHPVAQSGRTEWFPVTATPEAQGPE